ncbi:MAG: sugar phosphate isomerase/epimerase family protein [Candidatus Nitrosopolaris sp.]|jgi:sugar phosphate isomerase/epimerase
MTFKYSITLSSFRNITEPLEKTLERLTGQKYDAVEMFGEPHKLDLKSVNETFCSFGLPVCGITGMWGSTSEEGWKRRILTSNKEVLAYSQEYVKSCIKMCDFLGGGEVNLCLFADDEFVSFDRNHMLLSQDQKEGLIRRIAIPTLSKLTKYASDYGIQLLLEPLNRYSTPYCTTAKEALCIANQINQDNFGVLLDTFHMNIEEDSIERAIMESRRLLRHTHFADNNRKMPGSAHIDFHSIIKSLSTIKYDGYISFEPILTDDRYETATKDGLEVIKAIERSII